MLQDEDTYLAGALPWSSLFQSPLRDGTPLTAKDMEGSATAGLNVI